MIYKAPSLPYGGDYRGLAEYAEGPTPSRHAGGSSTNGSTTQHEFATIAHSAAVGAATALRCTTMTMIKLLRHPGEIASLARLHAQSRRTTYAGILSPQAYARIEDEEAESTRGTRLAEPVLDRAVLVAGHPGALCGFAMVTREDDELATVNALHVLGELHGAGHGTRAHRGDGFGRAGLGLPETPALRGHRQHHGQSVLHPSGTGRRRIPPQPRSGRHGDDFAGAVVELRSPTRDRAQGGLGLCGPNRPRAASSAAARPA